MRYLTAREAANLLNITRQGVWHAIHLGRLPAKKDPMGNYVILFDDLDKYLKSLHQRKDTLTCNGVKVFEKNNGALSVRDASEVLCVRASHVHYAILKGYLKRIRVGHMFVLKEEDVIKYKNSNKFKEIVKERNRRQLAV